MVHGNNNNYSSDFDMSASALDIELVFKLLGYTTAGDLLVTFISFLLVKIICNFMQMEFCSNDEIIVSEGIRMCQKYLMSVAHN